MNASPFELFLSVLGFLLTILGTVLWYNFRRAMEDIDRLKDELSKFQIHVAGNYATKDVLKDIFDKLDKINDSLNGVVNNFHELLNKKVDKS